MSCWKSITFVGKNVSMLLHKIKTTIVLSTFFRAASFAWNCKRNDDSN